LLKIIYYTIFHFWQRLHRLKHVNKTKPAVKTVIYRLMWYNAATCKTICNLYNMRKIFRSFGNLMRCAFLLLTILFFTQKTTAQFTATWALTTDRSTIVAGAQAANITAGIMAEGAAFVANGAFSTNGFQCKLASGNWPTVETVGDHLDFTLSPNAGWDINITGLTFTGRTSGSSGNNLVSLAYQTDGVGAFTAFGTPQVVPSGGTNAISFGVLSQLLPVGHTYIIRLYAYAAGAGTTNSRNLFFKDVAFTGTTTAPGNPPTVLTNSAATTGRNSGTAQGQITNTSLTAVTTSGLCWSTTINPTVALATKTTNGPLTIGTFNHAITGLTAGTLYHVRAYATNAVGTGYGADLTFTTNPPILATLTTTAITNLSIFTVSSGGAITDDGGAAIITRGVCWNTVTNPTIANSITTDGTGLGNYPSGIIGLLPSTTYYVRAYATNSVGTAYGNVVTFTTPPPTPTLTTSPTQLNFGTLLQNTISASQSFTLQGFYLNTGPGNITVNAPVGFRVSLSNTSGFAPSITVPYTGTALASTPIYVRFTPTVVKTFDDSVRTNGGGAPTVFVRVTGTSTPAGLQSGQGFSNKGKEFWVGYGATEKMYSDNSQDMRFTFSNTNNVPANVTITMPNKPTFVPVVYTVPAGGSITTNANDFPESGINDSRLLNEGVYTSGIKIAADTPIVVYCHAITSQVYAASVLFPTPTLGREYTSLNFRQRSNYSGARSYLFVIATEDNTQIEVTLPVGVETDTHLPGTTFTQTLNKGEILNLFGKYIGQPNLHTGNDLSGTVVKSISGTGNCKPFAMYCGASKITIDCDNGSNGSADNLFQQMFPKQAWGTKVIAIPTQPLPYNHYRVLVSDAAAPVLRNGVAMTGLQSNKYYEYYAATPSIDVYESIKPIMVAQYMTTHNECNNAGANGDPEMIYLSSVQQTIDTISFVASPLGTTTGRSHYLNVAIPTSGVAGFKLDGVTQIASFAPVPFDPSFSYAQFLNIAEGFHTVTAPSGFNATAFGIAGDESYGYNAGTNVKDLLTGFSLQNQFGTGTASNACRNNEFFVRVTLPYKPTSIVWSFNNNPNLTPNANFTQTNPVPIDSFIVNNQKLYVFRNPTPYLYNAVGVVPVTVSASNPVPDGCNGLQILNFTVNVVAGPTASFNFSNTLGCLGTPVQFTDNTVAAGFNLDLWQWNFGDAGSGANNTATLQNPLHTFSTGGTFSVTQRVITLEGCYDDSTRIINLSSIPVASFTAPAQGCQGQAVTFTNTATIASGTIAQWNWNFGTGAPVNATNGNAQTFTYTTPGTYNVSLTVVSTTGCTATIFTKQIIINALPTVTFATLAGTCTNTPAFALTAGSPAGGVYSGIGVVGGNIFNPAISGAGTFTLTYTYTTALGCINSTTRTIVVTQAFNLSITPITLICVNATPVTLIPSVTGGTFNGPGVTGNTFDPAIAGVGTHTITYVIGGNSCTIPATMQIVVNPKPFVNAGPDITMVFGYPVFLNGAVSDGTYNWTPPLGLSTPTALTTQANPTTTTLYTLTATNSFGCVNNDVMQLTVLVPCIDPPNVFTPNNDGYYDKWKVFSGTCTKNVAVDVYNRYGGLVYHSENYNNDWDGTYKGKPIPDGTYYYVVMATIIGDYKVPFKGNVTIMR
jgi:gliding motility-associated-like protein